MRYETNHKLIDLVSAQVLLDYLEQRIARGETLQGSDKEEYLRLLCKLKGDCGEGNKQKTPVVLF
jgi:hypothetical protein